MNTIEKKSVKAGNYIDRQQVDTMVRSYKQQTWVHNSDRIGKEDARSCWYTVEELEAFLEKIKTHGGDGVRMYFGIYPEGYNDNPEYEDRQAIVMVATRSQDGTHSTSKELHFSDGKDTRMLAYVSNLPCPAWCDQPAVPPIPRIAKAPVGVTLIDRGEKGMCII